MKLYFGFRCFPELNDSALCYIAAYHDVWLATGEEIIGHYLTSGAPF